MELDAVYSGFLGAPEQVDIIKPVSYTHLDVYKRQIMESRNYFVI